MSLRKVLHVVPSLGGEHTEHGAAIGRVASSLARLGVDTHIAATTARRESAVAFGAPVVDDSVTYWSFPRHVSCSSASIPLWSWLSRELTSFDIVHIHSLFSCATPPAALLARRLGVPYIVQPLDSLDVCGLPSLSPWSRARFAVLRSRVLRHAALVQFASEDERLVAEQLQADGAVDRDSARPAGCAHGAAGSVTPSSGAGRQPAHRPRTPAERVAR